MKTFRGKRGDRKRMYHPRSGRCISHNTVEFALSCNHGSNNGVCGLAIGTHDDMLYNLIVRQEPFLSRPTENVVFGLGQRTLHTLYHMTRSLFSSATSTLLWDKTSELATMRYSTFPGTLAAIRLTFLQHT